MNWTHVLGYSLSIGLVLALVGGMLFAIRLMSGDSASFQELRRMVEALFATPAHLQPEAPKTAAEREAAAVNEEGADAPFDECCPACQEPVTRLHRFCPSCELRLQD